MATSPNDLPNFVRPEVTAILPQLKLVERLRGGTPTMHRASAQYIHKWEGESDRVYDFRRKIESLFEGLTRIISSSNGLLFAKPPNVEWNASKELLEADFENIDAMGTSFPVFAKRFTGEAVSEGLGGILVDHTPAPKDVLVHPGNEKQLGLRPTWASYHRDQIINWRTIIVNGQRVFSLIVLREDGEAEVGLYGVAPVTKYRVLRLQNGAASWTLYRQVKDPADSMAAFTVEAAGFFRNKNGDIAPFIPFQPAYTGTQVGPMMSSIPLLGVAYANLAHWQISTDLRFYRALAAFPQPTVSGALMQQMGVDAAGNRTLVPGVLRIGPAVAVHLQENGKYGWTEIQGTSMVQLENGIKEKLLQMSILGLSFLMKETRGVETAEAKRLDAAAENADLATSAQGVEDCLNGAARFHAWYRGIEDPKQAPKIGVNRDFEMQLLDASTMQVYVNAARDIGYPVRDLLESWKAGGRIAADRNLDELERDMMANKMAEDALKMAEANAVAANASANADTGKKPPAAKP